LKVDATKPPKSVTTTSQINNKTFVSAKLRENIPNLDAGINVFIFFTFKLDNFDSKRFI
jgi:hypothetical protein